MPVLPTSSQRTGGTRHAEDVGELLLVLVL